MDGRQGVLEGVDVFLAAMLHQKIQFLIQVLQWTIRSTRSHGKTSHAGGAPEKGISALDAVEIMDVAVNYRENTFQWKQGCTI